MPNMVLQELSERLFSVYSVRAPRSTIDNWFGFPKISFKKNGACQQTGTSWCASGSDN